MKIEHLVESDPFKPEAYPPSLEHKQRLIAALHAHIKRYNEEISDLLMYAVPVVEDERDSEDWFMFDAYPQMGIFNIPSNQKVINKAKALQKRVDKFANALNGISLPMDQIKALDNPKDVQETYSKGIAVLQERMDAYASAHQRKHDAFKNWTGGWFMGRNEYDALPRHTTMRDEFVPVVEFHSNGGIVPQWYANVKAHKDVPEVARVLQWKEQLDEMVSTYDSIVMHKTYKK